MSKTYCCYHTDRQRSSTEDSWCAECLRERALAAEQSLEESRKQTEIWIGECNKGTEILLKLSRDCETAEQERDQLKAELQQAREAVKMLIGSWERYANKCESPVRVQAVAMCIFELRAILERIELSKLTICDNCGKPGSHFAPPSMGDSGFYVCERIEKEKK